MASQNEHFPVIKFLVQNGANIRADDDFVLRISSQKGRHEIVEFLIQNENEYSSGDIFGLVKESLKESLRGYLHINALVFSAGKGYLAISKILVENGVDINFGDGMVLDVAAKSGHLQLVEFLVKNGAKSDNALTLAATKGYLPVVKFLVKNGENIDLSLALKRSVEMTHYHVTHFLLENGANIDILHERGIEFLIEKNVIVNDTGSSIMQKAWDKLVQHVKDNYKLVLKEIPTAIGLLLQPGSIRFKILEHQFQYQDSMEEYRYMD